MFSRKTLLFRVSRYKAHAAITDLSLCQT